MDQNCYRIDIVFLCFNFSLIHLLSLPCALLDLGQNSAHFHSTTDRPLQDFKLYFPLVIVLARTSKRWDLRVPLQQAYSRLLPGSAINSIE